MFSSPRVLRQIIATSALSLVLASQAQAANVFAITNVGGNAIDHTQTGDLQSATGVVNSTGALYKTHLAVTQGGLGNQLKAAVYGGNNELRTTQDGTANTVALNVGNASKASEGNLAFLDVTGSSNKLVTTLTGAGSNNFATINGNNNDVTITRTRGFHDYDNGVYTNVYGNANKLNISSDGPNFSTVTESGSGNKLTITQTRPFAATPAEHVESQLTVNTQGDSNTDTHSQDGFKNLMTSSIYGSGNSSAGTQTGDGNKAVMTQKGFTNSVNVLQLGKTNSATGMNSGSTHVTSAVQSGNSNVVFESATGARNTLSTGQYGNGNKFTAVANGTDNVIAGTQNGNSNSLNTTITGNKSHIGDTKNAYALNQFGNTNTANITAGSDATMNLFQLGNSNNATLKDAGKHNSLTVQQVNNGNTTKVTLDANKGNTTVVSQNRWYTGTPVTTGPITVTPSRQASQGSIANVTLGKDANDNKTSLIQAGSNLANVAYDKGASKNNVDIQQNGAGGNSIDLHIGETAIANTVLLSQDGTNNLMTANLLPSASGNAVMVSQAGMGNSFSTSIRGSNNTLEVAQNGNANVMTTLQDGNQNHIGYAQNGNNLKANIEQYGTGKTVSLTQTSATPVVNIVQH